jgi:hypothetical protein
VRDEDLIREGGDHLVAAQRRVPGDAPGRCDEGREHEQATRVEGGAAFRREAHAREGSGRAEDDGLLAAQEDAQARLLDGRVKAADDRGALIAQAPRGVVGAQDRVAGRAGRAEERGSVPAAAGRL